MLLFLQLSDVVHSLIKFCFIYLLFSNKALKYFVLMISTNIQNLPFAYSGNQPHSKDSSEEVLKDKNTSKDKEDDSQNLTVKAKEQEFSQEELKQIKQLKARDREVKAHEQAHLSAAGSYALGGTSYTYQKGPDGVNYAIGGEVNIDTSEVPGDPTATLRKAETIRRAALAPAEPSTQDQTIAQKASAMAAKARAELYKNNEHQSIANQPNNPSVNISV